VNIQLKSLEEWLAREPKVYYLPQNRKVIGSVESVILLQRAISLFMEAGREPFCMFRKPCSHSVYHEGLSWTEELGLTESKFDTALSRIGTKIADTKTAKGMSRADALEKTDPTGLVLYWTDTDRVTWYMVNIALVNALGISAYDTWTVK